MERSISEAQAAFVDGVGRGGDIQKDSSSLRDDFGDGIAIVAAIGPESFVVPDVFTDGDAQLLVAESVDGLLVRGLEVARLIEDIVGGQQHFALLKNDAALGDEGRFVGDGFSVAVFYAAGVAHDGRQRQLGGQLFQLLVISIDEGGAFEEVLGQVSAQAKLGKNGQIGAALVSGVRQAEDAGGIACKIAYGGIKLRERYFHAGILGYGSADANANGAARSVSSRKNGR